MHVPGDPDWSESNLLTNAFGQGVAVTPLQMITAVSAIANDGLMMQPNIVSKIVTNGQANISQPIALSHPISTETAHIVRDMMVAVVQNGLDDAASLPGYSIAGKTGTAEIAGPVKYRSDAWIMSFIGFLPADFFFAIGFFSICGGKPNKVVAGCKAFLAQNRFPLI